MDNKATYPWVAFYIEFANRLLAFANDRKPLVDIIKSVYEQIGINLPKLEKNTERYLISTRSPCLAFLIRVSQQKTALKSSPLLLKSWV